MFEFAMNIRKSIATLSIVLVLGTALVQCVGRMALTLRVHAYVMGIQNKWLSWFAFLVCVILPVYGIAILADTIVLNSMEFWTGENPLARGANPPQKEFVREEQSGDERVVFRYGDYGRTLEIEFYRNDLQTGRLHLKQDRPGEVYVPDASGELALLKLDEAREPASRNMLLWAGNRLMAVRNLSEGAYALTRRRADRLTREFETSGRMYAAEPTAQPATNLSF